MIVQVITLKSDLSEAALLNRAQERASSFEAIPGLLQKYYVKTSQEGEYGGVYIWDSVEALQTYQQSDLAQSIPSAYAIKATPTVDIMDVIFQLRDA